MINLVSFTLIFFLFYFCINKLNYFSKFLVDKDYKKIQSFHNKPVINVGGLLIILSLFFYGLLIDDSILNLKFLIAIGILNFLIGIFDDLKLIVNPLIRFFLLVACNLALIIYYDFSIKSFGVFFLDSLNQIIFFKYLLVLLAIFFIINGSNLVDGFNGLLGIHSIIILLILSFTLSESSYELIHVKNYLYVLITATACFLILNFPKAKIFLGDGGAYFLGSQISCISIIIYNTSDFLSPFFISIILSYLFFEIFFSVFRKLYEKKNPFLPDGFHMHMIVYRHIKKKINLSNPATSICLNLIYIILILPSLFYYDKDFYCMIHFLIMIIVYMTFYFYLRNKKI